MHKTKLKLPSSSLCRDQTAQTICCSDDTDHNHDIYLQFHSFQMLKPVLDDRFIFLSFYIFLALNLVPSNMLIFIHCRCGTWCWHAHMKILAGCRVGLNSVFSIQTVLQSVLQGPLFLLKDWSWVTGSIRSDWLDPTFFMKQLLRSLIASSSTYWERCHISSSMKAVFLFITKANIF